MCKIFSYSPSASCRPQTKALVAASVSITLIAAGALLLIASLNPRQLVPFGIGIGSTSLGGVIALTTIIASVKRACTTREEPPPSEEPPFPAEPPPPEELPPPAEPNPFEEARALYNAVQPAFTRARASLDTLDRDTCTISDLGAIMTTLLQDPDIRELRNTEINEESPKPLIQANEELRFITWGVLEKTHYIDFYRGAVRELEDEPLVDGEIKIEDNGDCLFDSVIRHIQAIDSNYNKTAQVVREETVAWMEANHKNDEVFQGHLRQAITEHIFGKIQRLEDERAGLVAMPEITADREGEIATEVADLFERFIGPLCEGADLDPFLDDYFTEMRQHGTHGGAAELYALCRQHGVQIILNDKEEGELTGRLTSFPEEAGDYTAVFHLTKTRNHFNTYFPPA